MYKKKIYIFSFTIFITLFLTNYSYAYLDPISGSFVIQSIVAIFGGIVIFYKKIKNFLIKKILRKKDVNSTSWKKKN